MTVLVDGEAKGALALGPVTAIAVTGATAYVALAAGGVAVVDLSDPAAPREVSRFAEGRLVSRLLLSGDELVLVEQRSEALAFDVSNPAAPARRALVGPAPAVAVTAAAPMAMPMPAPAPMAGPVVPRGRVVEVRLGRVIVETTPPLEEGAHIRIVSQAMVDKPDLKTGQLTPQPSNEVTAVLRVENVEGHRAMAQLGRGDVAAAGDLAVATHDELSERLFLPRRAPFEWRFAGAVRPFLGLGTTTKPVGFIIDASASWYLKAAPLVIQATVAPFGLALGATESHYPFVGALTVAYTTDYFEIGLGVGALVGNRGPCPPAAGNCEQNTGLTINQVLRLGALDGLSVSWQSSIFSRPDQFVLGVGRGEVQIPLTNHLALFGGGGAGENGWAFGEFGVRTTLRGNGASGTTIISASLGNSSVFDGPKREEVSGPSVSIGVEWRR